MKALGSGLEKGEDPQAGPLHPQKGFEGKLGLLPAAESKFFPTKMETLDPRQRSQDAGFTSSAASDQAAAGLPGLFPSIPGFLPSFHSLCHPSPAGEKKPSVL